MASVNGYYRTTIQICVDSLKNPHGLNQNIYCAVAAYKHLQQSNTTHSQ